MVSGSRGDVRLRSTDLLVLYPWGSVEGDGWNLVSGEGGGLGSWSWRWGLLVCVALVN